MHTGYYTRRRREDIHHGKGHSFLALAEAVDRAGCIQSGLLQGGRVER